MSKPSKRATIWIVVFLTVTAIALVMELWASWDGNDATWPWTDLIVEYIPFEVTMLVIGGLALWLVVHFGLRYWRKHRASQIASQPASDPISQDREYSPNVTDEAHGRYIDEIKPGKPVQSNRQDEPEINGSN